MTAPEVADSGVARFRRLVLWFGAFYVLSNVLPLSHAVNAALLPPGASALLDQNGTGAILFPPPVVSISIPVLMLVVTFGVYSMAALALRLFLLLTIFSTCLTLVEGVYVGSPILGLLGFPTVLLQGAVLGLGYLSELRTRFR